MIVADVKSQGVIISWTNAMLGEVTEKEQEAASTLGVNLVASSARRCLNAMATVARGKKPGQMPDHRRNGYLENPPKEQQMLAARRGQTF